MTEERYVAIIGGLNLDLAGLSGKIYREKDSNIGSIQMGAGGVGHNIGHNLTRLEVPTYLITVYGDDYFGEILANECEINGIHLDHAAKIKGKRSSSYLYVADNHGDMVTAINDMGIVDVITPEFLAQRLDFINGAEIVVLDGNLSQTAIEWLAENCSAPIFVDPVSIAKVERFKNVLDKIDTFKPNELEAEILTGIAVNDLESGTASAKALNEMGVKNVFISLGAKGILCSRNQEVRLVPTLPTKIKSANGAGDCTMATITWARFQYGDVLPLEEVGLFSQAAASITLASYDAVSPELSVRNVVKKAQENYERSGQ